LKLVKFIVSFLTFSLTPIVNGQLVTTPGTPPSSLVQDVLLGPGVIVSNITFNGNASAVSRFTAAGTNLGISSGIVMTTGTTFDNGSGPQGPNNQGSAGFDNNFGGSGILSAIIGGTPTFNSATLEFDFIPFSDTVRFKYVFGSEEYPEYAPPNNSAYNDVFGFFISGPGIIGNQNIARLPSGDIVSINNVNAVTNSAFFKENGDGSTGPYNASPVYIQYDGFTDVLTASSKVQCGKTYHLILAIADVGDAVFDSGIFLEANSLSSNTPVDITYKLSQIAFPSNPNKMAEGCVSTTITLKRGGNTTFPITIPVTISGTATEGTDYSDIPGSVTIPAGQTTTTLTIDALTDILPESEETISISFQITDPCGNVNPIVVDLSIEDIQPVSVSIKSGSIVCPGDDVELIAVPSGGLGPYIYTWNTGQRTPSIFVSPGSSQTYSVSVTDNCLKKTVVGSGIVNVPVYPPIEIKTTEDITEICPYISSSLEASVSGGAGNYSYSWVDNNGITLGNQSTQIVNPSATTRYILTVTDNCGIMERAEINYTVTSPPLLITMSPEVEICPGDSALIDVTATGGYGKYTYKWPESNQLTPSIWVKPLKTSVYEVRVSDECQTFEVIDRTTVKVVKPDANFMVTSQTLFDDLPITFQNLTTNVNTYQWYFGDGKTSTSVNPSHTYDEPGTYNVTLITINEIGCIDTIVKPITIEEAYYVYVPNAFTPDGFRFNELFEASTLGVKELKVRIFNRWGELIFESDDIDFQWDGKYNGQPVQDGSYIWKLNIKTNSGRDILSYGHINCLR
jgi:gliding motility-associated-like protein